MASGLMSESEAMTVFGWSVSTPAVIIVVEATACASEACPFAAHGSMARINMMKYVMFEFIMR